MKIIVYPAFDAFYYSFYWAGLKKVFPDARFTYSVKPFPRFHHHCLAFILDGKRVYISSGDGPGLNQDALAWAHVYGKVNLLDEKEAAASSSLLVPIGPSFGIQVWSLANALFRSLLTLGMSNQRLGNKREHVANYYRQWRYRMRLESYSYRPEAVKDGFVFFAGALWKKEPGNNQLRANFIQAVRGMNSVQFEGGFAPRADMRMFSRQMLNERYSYPKYIHLLRSSQVAYNTPAVQDCLGWKLGEYLALGKAIISTPLTRKMPMPLKHGEHIHFVDGTPNSIRDAVMEITENKNYRFHLEQGARGYWEKHLAPARVIERLVHAAGTQI